MDTTCHWPSRDEDKRQSRTTGGSMTMLDRSSYAAGHFELRIDRHEPTAYVNRSSAAGATPRSPSSRCGRARSGSSRSPASTSIRSSSSSVWPAPTTCSSGSRSRGSARTTTAATARSRTIAGRLSRALTACGVIGRQALSVRVAAFAVAALWHTSAPLTELQRGRRDGLDGHRLAMLATQ